MLYDSRETHAREIALTNTNRSIALASGLANGLLISIPLWVLIGIVLVTFFMQGPLNETASVVFMIAAVCEAILARHALRAYRGRSEDGPRDHPESTARTQASFVNRVLRRGAAAAAHGTPRRVAHGNRPRLRQAGAFGALAIAYLQYYFWDVNLQIASLNSVTVFVPVPS